LTTTTLAVVPVVVGARFCLAGACAREHRRAGSHRRGRWPAPTKAFAQIRTVQSFRRESSEFVAYGRISPTSSTAGGRPREAAGCFFGVVGFVRDSAAS
jgi:hypothetical protein